MSDTPTVREARAILRDGGVVAYPTETLYGLGVSVRNEDAVDRLYKLKGLPPERGVSVLFDSFDHVGDVVQHTALGTEVAARMLPGPVTLVFDAGPDAPARVASADGTIGVRVSPHLVAQELCRGIPITSTSANIHGRPPPETAETVRRALGNAVDVVLDGGVCGGPGSTVVDVRGDEPVVLREGQVPADRFAGLVDDGN